ncbi:MAG: bifunctional tetrahydrofolate synthase/dihydrofolate synthase [Thiohalocapsa sp.]|jgi:dihydrofolate synthase/folylpolyglutamate synthase|uniref:bifunctional tetrahydrofolate synthase/dihydrofolate synthase n=1 Tax=Thiohalocapsa sp. TaxID=2497641 RepID=UPI0025E88B21|nr:bifunctional tetrahydrofolate synthase/dihydrofolate synthase [Thiohalocapsa sp.]MCG6941118.1 bifunctional tetrahydrofolate synthase/dihydrofolate synthase [Thiohalocapsa sp.]
MRFDNLTDWLAWQETLHPSRIDLRLERVGGVWDALGLGPLGCPVITVGGTNGKGSVVAYLEAMYRAAGYRAGAYTSPHLLRYNERIRIDGTEADDAALCDAFARIDAARGDAMLTYFEFGTLAALALFADAAPDVVLLEVGLGGRLDAVNIIDADVAVVTSIGRDHVAWLGDTPAQIAFEKAGIFRPGRPAVIGQADAPPRLRERALEIGATPLQLGREFRWRGDVGQWHWQGDDGQRRNALPPPALRGRFQYDNAAAAICTLECLRARLPVETAALRLGLHRVWLPGRFSVLPRVLPGGATWVLDVAHNPEAARVLAQNLAALGCRGVHHAIVGVSADKDAAAVVAELSGWVDTWHAVPAPGPRGMAAGALVAAIAESAPGAPVRQYDGLDAAVDTLLASAGTDACVLVFGSFTTVEAALRNPAIAPV